MFVRVVVNVYFDWMFAVCCVLCVLCGGVRRTFVRNKGFWKTRRVSANGGIHCSVWLTVIRLNMIGIRIPNSLRCNV